MIKSYTDAIFIGEEPGVNPVTVVANDILTLILPHSKIAARIPFIKAEINANFANTGRGMLPDIPMKQSFEAFRANEDDVLDKTIKWILEQD